MATARATTKRATQAAAGLPTHEWRDRLRHAGLRMTAPRLAALSTLATLGGHQDAETVTRAAREQLGGTLSTQAVYNNLHALTGAGLVRRIELPGQPARYELRVGDNHHHLVCRVCGDTRDVDCATGYAPCLAPSDSHGFAIDEAEVTYWGVCAACQDNKTDISSETKR